MSEKPLGTSEITTASKPRMGEMPKSLVSGMVITVVRIRTNAKLKAAL